MIPTPPPPPAATPPPPTLAPSPTAPSGPARRILAVVVAVIGLLVAVVLWISAGSRFEQAVRDLARAPVGCDTTLDVADPGDYLIFVETRGELPEVRGDCAAGGAFDLAAERAPTVDITIVDPDGSDVPFVSRRDRENYDAAGFTGSSLARVSVDTSGDHVIRVETASDSVFAVSVGRDPSSGVAALRGAAIAVALVGLLLSGLLMVVDRRRRRPAPATHQPIPPDAGIWGAPPPVGPPPMQAPTGPPTWQPTPPGPSGPPTTWQPAPPPPSAAPDPAPRSPGAPTNDPGTRPDDPFAPPS